MKCKYCEKYRVRSPFKMGAGYLTLQIKALCDHEKFQDHQLAKRKWMAEMEEQSFSLSKHAINMVEANKARSIIVIKLMSHTALNTLSSHSYKPLCCLIRHLQAPDMPANDKYSTYTNEVSGRDSLMACSLHVNDTHASKIAYSSFYY